MVRPELTFGEIIAAKAAMDTAIDLALEGFTHGTGITIEVSAVGTVCEDGEIKRIVRSHICLR